VVFPDDSGKREAVYSSVQLVEPVITSKLALNTTAISGTATPSTTGANGATVMIGVYRFPLGDPCRKVDFKQLPALTSDKQTLTFEEDENQQNKDVNSNHNDDSQTRDDKGNTGAELKCEPHLAQLAVAASGSTPATSATTVQTQTNGRFALALATPPQEDEQVRIAQILPPGTQFAEGAAAVERAYSTPVDVPSVADWGRIRADFVAGLLTTNNNLISSTDSGNFTQAHQFLAMVLEKSWTLPGCYVQWMGGCVRQTFETTDKGQTSKDEVQDQHGWTRYHRES